MSGLPAKVIQEKINRDPTEEECLVDKVLVEGAVVILRPAILDLFAGGIGKQTANSKGNGYVDLDHRPTSLSETLIYKRCRLSLPVERQDRHRRILDCEELIRGNLITEGCESARYFRQTKASGVNGLEMFVEEEDFGSVDGSRHEGDPSSARF